MNFYENEYEYSKSENEGCFICLPSMNFGYGYPTANTGFIYFQNASDQSVVNETF